MHVVTNISPQHEAALETVVILCAEEATRDAIAYWLSSAPTRAIIAADGYEASRALKDNPCHLLITDRVLPPWPGLETFMSMRLTYPRLQIAFLDDGSPDARSLARVTGAHVVLPKPLTRPAVLAALPRVAAKG